MKPFFILFLFISYRADCQPTVTDATNKRIMEWDSTYQVEGKHFRAGSDDEISYYYSVKKNNKLFAEYFRHSDTSFLFVRYDTANQRKIQRGLIKFCDEVLDSFTFQIQDLILDPNGNKGLFKDTLIHTYSYRKDGIWWELDSMELIWKGNYNNGLRTGKWEEGTYPVIHGMDSRVVEVLYDNFRPYLAHKFQNGIEIPLYQDSIFYPTIKGRWSRESKPNKETVFWTKTKQRSTLNFTTNEKVIISRLPKGALQQKKYNALEKVKANWRQQRDLIIITDNDKTSVFRILKLSSEQMIVRVIHSELSNYGDW